jgi:predicted component of type VI protein secretion system
VPHNSVSSVHARIYRDGGAWYLEDVGSSNGTFVGNARLEEPVQLSVGLRFSLSRYKYEVVSLGDDDSEEVTGSLQGYGLPSAGAPAGWEDHEDTDDDGPPETDAEETRGFDDDDEPDMDLGEERPRSSRKRPPSPTSQGGGSFVDRWLGLMVMGVSIGVTGIVAVVIAGTSSAGTGAADIAEAAHQAAEAAAAKTTEAQQDAAEKVADAEEATDVATGAGADAQQADAAEADAAADEGGGGEEEDEASADAGSVDPSGGGDFQAFADKLAKIDKALKKNKKLLKKKGVKALYKQLHKKTKKVEKKFAKKAKKKKKKKKLSKADDKLMQAELFKETGALVDELYAKVF